MAVPHTHTHVFAVVHACIRVPQVRAEDLNFDVRGVRQMLKEVRNFATATARALHSRILCHIDSIRGHCGLRPALFIWQYSVR